jgi:tetratricopeptide (TPR) repeat protein
MNRKLILSAVFFSGLAMSSSLYGQIKKLKTVRAEVIRDDRDIEKAKYDIDMVMENSETANNAAAFGWKGVVYGEIANLDDTSALRISLDPNKSAAYTSAESFLKFYSFSEEQQEQLDAKIYAQTSLPNTIINNYNLGVMALSGKNRFTEVKKYMEAVEKMIKYDVDQVAKTRGITVESTYYNTWTAAYMDSLVNDEIIYLERLAAVPTYLKADIFIRLSMIYSDRKDYDKALDYLEKGKVKIPQRASEFLEQQINIELSRNNHAIILAKFTEAIANNPDNANYYFSRGVTYHQLKLNELESQEAAYKRGEKVPASKYSFKQCLTDYTKAISLDNSNFDALNNEAVAIFDSANYMYKQMTKVSASEFDRYKTSASGLYRLSMSKFEVLKQSGFLKGEDYINLLKDMKTCAARTGNVEERNKLDDLIKSEKAKLEGVGK